ncbi:MAG: hypothetical protein F6K14_26740 [Symploca sp. SIO2C1]|nr:hypothetical protein [Symploca sp. SIO2C1]
MIEVTCTKSDSLILPIDGGKRVDLLDITVSWGVRPEDQWHGYRVGVERIENLLAQIRKSKSVLTTKTLVGKLQELDYLDYRYGVCQQSLDEGICQEAIIIPGSDGHKCPKCGWVGKPYWQAGTRRQR